MKGNAIFIGVVKFALLSVRKRSLCVIRRSILARVAGVLDPTTQGVCGAYPKAMLNLPGLRYDLARMFKGVKSRQGGPPRKSREVAEAWRAYDFVATHSR